MLVEPRTDYLRPSLDPSEHPVKRAFQAGEGDRPSLFKPMKSAF
jgi:hypothetical protein